MDYSQTTREVPATTLQTIVSLTIDIAALATLTFATHILLNNTAFPPSLIWTITAATCTAVILTWCHLKGRHSDYRGFRGESTARWGKAYPAMMRLR